VRVDQAPERRAFAGERGRGALFGAVVGEGMLLVLLLAVEGRRCGLRTRSSSPAPA